MAVALAFGPPGHKGVTTLMSVGADPLGADDTVEANVRTGGYLAAGLWLVGVATGNRALRRLGFGAAVALFGVQVLARK